MGLADLHIHTIYSYDGTAPIASVLTQAKKIGLDVIAITDHDEINGSLKALELATQYGVEVIPGIEITTAEGDLLALNITQKIERGQPLIDTILQVGEAGGFCIAPHPMAGGLAMKSLSAYSIMKALRTPDAAKILIALETYNATAIDRMSNQHAHNLAETLHITKTGSSDAHIIQAIGLGTTGFKGHTARDLIRALYKGKVYIQKQKELSPAHMLSIWAAKYIGSAFTRLVNAA